MPINTGGRQHDRAAGGGWLLKLPETQRQVQNASTGESSNSTPPGCWKRAYVEVAHQIVPDIAAPHKREMVYEFRQHAPDL